MNTFEMVFLRFVHIIGYYFIKSSFCLTEKKTNLQLVTPIFSLSTYSGYVCSSPFIVKSKQDLFRFLRTFFVCKTTEIDLVLIYL